MESGEGAAATVQPSTVVGKIDPLTAGAVVSSTNIVCTISTLVLVHSSVTL